MNFQTKRKIEEIKEQIKNKVALNIIIKEKFGTTKKKDSWLDKNYNSFTSNEIKYLNYSFTPELIETEEINVLEEEKKDILQNKTPAFNFDLSISKTFKSFEDLKTPQDRLSFLLNDKVLKALFFMTEGKNIKNEAEATLRYNLENTKNKYSKNIKIKNIRINEELYKEFTDFCENNKITIISALSCALEEFLDKYKELKENE